MSLYPWDAIDPPDDSEPEEGYPWSPKDDIYWDMRVDMARDDGI